MVELESGRGKCSVYDVVEVVKEANSKGEALMTIKDVIKKLKGRDNCRDYSDRTLYAKVERALKEKAIMFDPYRGFIAVDLKHKDLVLKACQLIFCEEVTCKVLREELGLQYEGLDEVVELVEIALQHVITYWEERVRGRVEEVKVLVERLRSAREQLEVMEGDVEREIIAERMRAIKQLEDEVRRLEKGLHEWCSELRGLTKVFYLRSKEKSSLDGWCELCSRKSIDEGLKAVIRDFIEMSGVKEKLDKLWRPWVVRIKTISGWAIIE